MGSAFRHLSCAAILLMSNVGVPDEAFMTLQDNMVAQLSQMFDDKSDAIDLLARHHVEYQYSH